jgi:gamma-glutamyltranspeptidase / glutathione hydrolase
VVYRVKLYWLLVGVFLGSVAAAPYPEWGRAVVSADHVLASQAGLAALEGGGNAVDAVIAAALAAGVVQPAGSGLGGGGFALVGLAGGDTRVLDFREVAPAGATENMYRAEDGTVISDRSRYGAYAVAVPGESRGLAELLRQHGKLTAKQVAGPAIALAEKGFLVGPHLAVALERTRLIEVQNLFSRDGAVVSRGTRVRRPRLAQTLRRWASSFGEDLYIGRGADAIQRTLAESPGAVTGQDLENYAPKPRQPITIRYGDYVVETMPPPSSGGVCLGQMLRVLDGRGLAAMGHNSSAYIHLLVEAMKHAYADRAHHLGDPDFVEVGTAGLLSDERVGVIREKFDPKQTFEAEYYGALIQSPKDAGTQHISALDADGVGAALTTTINTSFGSGVVVEELGIILNNEMDDFAAAPGVPNAYGLIGGSANAIAPGKRPLSSMTPTVVRDSEGQVVMTIGASGGSMIISSVLQVFLNVVEFGMDPQEAVAAARFHHQWQPDHIFLEGAIPEDVRRGLEERGHQTKRFELYSSVQLSLQAEGGILGGSDPRKGGWPAGMMP